MSRNKSIALDQIQKLAQDGLVTIIFDESTKGNIVKIKLLEFDNNVS